MRVLARPDLLVRRGLSALERQIPAALAGDVEGVHQARVASRRLRESLPMLRDARHRGQLRAAGRDVRRITRTLGPLREQDVTLELLAAHETATPWHAPSIGTVRLATLTDRARTVETVSATLAGRPLRRAARRLAAVLRGQASPAAARRCARHLAVRLNRRARTVTSAVRAVGSVYAPGPLHAVRIALKKFRYALELAARLGRFRIAGSLKRLKAMQDLLGDLHDLQVLTARVRDCEAVAADGPARAAMTALAAHLDEQIRQLHSRFVSERQLLDPVIGRARRVGVVLRTLPGRPAPAAASRRATPVVVAR